MKEKKGTKMKRRKNKVVNELTSQLLSTKYHTLREIRSSNLLSTEGRPVLHYVVPLLVVLGRHIFACRLASEIREVNSSSLSSWIRTNTQYYRYRNTYATHLSSRWSRSLSNQHSPSENHCPVPTPNRWDSVHPAVQSWAVSAYIHKNSSFYSACIQKRRWEKRREKGESRKSTVMLAANTFKTRKKEEKKSSHRVSHSQATSFLQEIAYDRRLRLPNCHMHRRPSVLRK